MDRFFEDSATEDELTNLVIAWCKDMESTRTEIELDKAYAESDWTDFLNGKEFSQK